MRKVIGTMAGAAMVLALASGLAAATPYFCDTLVTNGSHPTPFSQNKQNEPAVAVNPCVPTIAAAGVNDEIDLEACNNRERQDVSVHDRRRRVRHLLLRRQRLDWTQPSYTGWTARDCLGVVGTQPANPADNCDPHVGPIGTLPRYYENGLVADGDPAVGVRPATRRERHVRVDERLAAVLREHRANFSAERSEQAFKGFEAIAVSRLDSQNYAAAKAGDNNAWKAPVIVSKQNCALFSDHEMIAVDDASRQPVLRQRLRLRRRVPQPGEGRLPGADRPQPLVRRRRHVEPRAGSPAVNNATVGGRQDCAVEHRQQGNGLRVLGRHRLEDEDARDLHDPLVRRRQARSSVRRQVVTPHRRTGLPDPERAVCRSTAPRARAAGRSRRSTSRTARRPDDTRPTRSCSRGRTARRRRTRTRARTSRCVCSWSKNGGGTWTSGGIASPATDRPDFPAIAISPDGERRVPDVHELPRSRGSRRPRRRGCSAASSGTPT